MNSKLPFMRFRGKAAEPPAPAVASASQRAVKALTPLLAEIAEGDQGAFLQAAAALAFDGVVALRAVHDEAGEITDLVYLYANEEAAHLLGAPARVLQGSRFRRSADEATQSLFSKIREVIERGAILDTEMSYMVAERRRWYRVRARRYGEGVVMVYNDITPEKQRQAALNAARRRFSDLTESVPGVVYQFRRDAAGHYSLPFCTSAMQAVWGITAEEAMQNVDAVFALVLPEDMPGLMESIEQSARLIAPWHLQFRIKVGTRVKWISARSKPQAFGDGSLVWNGYMTDVTDRRLSEIALQQSESRFRDLVDTIPGVVYQWYARASGQTGFYFVSPRVQDYLGLTARQVMDNPLCLRFHPDDEAQRHETLRDAVASGRDWRFSGRLLLEDGSIHYFRTIARPKLVSGEETVLNGVLIDVSQTAPVRDEAPPSLTVSGVANEALTHVLQVANERLAEQKTALEETSRKLEEARAAAETARNAAETASRTKSDFLAMMSHELRTPLNAIIGFSDMIKSEILGPLGNKRYETYIEDIHDAGGLLLSLVDDILDLSKIEAGRMELRPEVLDVAAAVEQAEKLILPRAAARNIRLLMELKVQAPHLLVDPRAFKQMLMNLLSNAVKYTRPAGEVMVIVRRRNDRGLDISVRDTGIGMSREDFMKALHPFGQIDNQMTRSEHGTGLGLPIVRAMVEGHGGHLDLDSDGKAGEGTMITLRFPPHRTVEN